MTTACDRLADAVDELTTDRRRHVWLEYYDPRQHRRIRRKVDGGSYSLVGLLELDVQRDDDTAVKATSASTRGGFTSRPPGHYVPRELLAGLARDVTVWLAWCGLDETGDQAVNCAALRAIGPALDEHADAYPGALDELAHAMTRWATELRRYAGLELTWQPRSACPQCSKVGALTIWVSTERRRPERARCAHCRTTWDELAVDRLCWQIRHSGDAA